VKDHFGSRNAGASHKPLQALHQGRGSLTIVNVSATHTDAVLRCGFVQLAESEGGGTHG